MRHIFCGEIDNNYQAKGFHSNSYATNWRVCAVIQDCQTFPNLNGHCRDVFIYHLHDAYYELKESDSTLWPATLSPAQLVPMFQDLYNRCPPAIDNAVLCFPNCRWNGNNNRFDIVIGTGIDDITTAYPARRGACRRHPNWQDCDTSDCQNL